MAKRARRVAIYARVSTDGQSVDNQLRELTSVAERHGWDVATTYTDEGISGTVVSVSKVGTSWIFNLCDVLTAIQKSEHLADHQKIKIDVPTSS